MPFSVTCVALDTTRGFVVLSISEFEVRSRLLLTEWSIVVEGKLSFVVIISYHMISSVRIPKYPILSSTRSTFV
mgnify:CR=1 FL=1